MRIITVIIMMITLFVGGFGWFLVAATRDYPRYPRPVYRRDDLARGAMWLVCAAIIAFVIWE